MRRSVLVALLATAPSTHAFAAEYTIDPGAGSRVEFVSKAPVESFSGKSDRVSGSLTLDPAALGDSIQVRIEVDMASPALYGSPIFSSPMVIFCGEVVIIHTPAATTIRATRSPMASPNSSPSRVICV